MVSGRSYSETSFFAHFSFLNQLVFIPPSFFFSTSLFLLFLSYSCHYFQQNVVFFPFCVLYLILLLSLPLFLFPCLSLHIVLLIPIAGKGMVRIGVV